MIRISKEIELAKFKTRLLYHEKDRRTVTIRQLKQKYTALLEENEEIGMNKLAIVSLNSLYLSHK